ncbi:MAG: 3-isopropylmalate dehydratase small subunit [Gammaproteobacteria bacterium]|jgi:3-isopropylmalate/(R)-2-methylmalate dehydratase small subunit|nr:3-isopropylmalate dehydratase small subunit [Gammaproteobacteria bacterium]
MKAYEKHESIVALMNRNNVDTDQIIPKQFLKKVERSGFGAHLFHDWRFNADGTDNPEFELNNPAFKNAGILLVGDNFGCGSSREHAPWAIADYGFNTIISTSYADIFFNNCFKNGILPIIVSKQELDTLMDEVASNEGAKFKVDLENQQLSSAKGTLLKFELDSFRKDNLLKGLDDIGLTLKIVEKIGSFEEKQKQSMPWLWA